MIGDQENWEAIPVRVTCRSMDYVALHSPSRLCHLESEHLEAGGSRCEGQEWTGSVMWLCLDGHAAWLSMLQNARTTASQKLHRSDGYFDECPLWAANA